jgi:ribosome-associated protein
MRAAAGFCDYFIIVTANSLRQVNAISEAVQHELEGERIKPLSQVSPHDESGWVVLDFGPVVVHIFSREMREFYSLEHLWSDAQRLRLPKKKAS